MGAALSQRPSPLVAPMTRRHRKRQVPGRRRGVSYPGWCVYARTLREVRKGSAVRSEEGGGRPPPTTNLDADLCHRTGAAAWRDDSGNRRLPGQPRQPRRRHSAGCTYKITRPPSGLRLAVA
ncbi:hypothetical protein MRX96_001149 [Rhipicephalus microplus]